MESISRSSEALGKSSSDLLNSTELAKPATTSGYVSSHQIPASFSLLHLRSSTSTAGDLNLLPKSISVGDLKKSK